MSFLAQGTPVNEDPIRRRDLCSKFYHGLAIHGDPSLQDDLSHSRRLATPEAAIISAAVQLVLPSFIHAPSGPDWVLLPHVQILYLFLCPPPLPF